MNFENLQQNEVDRLADEELADSFERELNTESELTVEQNQLFAKIWTELVVENEGMPDDIGTFKHEQMSEWLFQALMHDTARLLDEWNIHADEGEVKKIITEDDAERKSELELIYMQNILQQVHKLTKDFDRNEGTRWNSWPNNMRESKSFNCVGATLLGMELLENSGIKSYYGNPVGHVVNIVQLSNEEWYYLDLLNNKCEHIIPEEIEIEGQQVLKIDNKHIEYELVPFRDNEDISTPIFGNFVHLYEEANDPDVVDDYNKQYARQYVQTHKSIFNGDDSIKNIRDVFYADNQDINNSEEMDRERQRIDDYDKYTENVQEYVSALEEKERKKIFEEISKNISGVEEFLRKDDDNIINSVSVHTSKFLQLLKGGVEELKKVDQQRYNNLMSSFINKFSNEKFIQINEALSYGISEDGKIAHIHVVPSRDEINLEGRDSIKKFKEIFLQGLQELAIILEKEDSFEYVTATSKMVKNNPKLIQKLGFEDMGMIDKKMWQEHFAEDNQEDIHFARMNRNLFLEKYLNNIE